MTDKTFKALAPEMAGAVRWGAKHADNMVVLEIEGNTLTVSGFRDPNLSRAKCDVTQQFDGKEKLSVHADILLNALKVFKKDTVTFTIERSEGGAGKLVATNGKGRVTMPFSGEGTRMKLPTTPEELGTVMTEDFKRAVDDVAESAATPDAAQALILTAVNMRFFPSKNLVVLTTTNRYRLTMRKVEMNFTREHDLGEVGSFDVNLSARELKSLLKDVDVDGTLKLLYNVPALNTEVRNSIFGISGSYQMALTGVVDGDYINYRKLIKDGGENQIVFDRKSLLTSVNDAKTFLERGDKRITLSASQENVTLSSEVADFDFDVEFDKVKFPDEKKIDISVEFLVPAVGVCRAEKISFEFNGPGQPIMVFDLNDDGSKSDQTYNMLVALIDKK